MRYDTLIWFDRDSGFYLADVPDLPGCGSQGSTGDEAAANIAEAIALYVSSVGDDGFEPPEPNRYELRTINVD